MNSSSAKPTPAWRRMVGKAAALAFAVGVLTAVGAVSAHAATTPAQADFTAQAKRAGLSSTNAKVLQKRVNRYLAKYHGKQIAANKISAKGMYITVALPGEKYARTLPATSGMHTTDTWTDMCYMGGPTGPQLGGSVCTGASTSRAMCCRCIRAVTITSTAGTATAHGETTRRREPSHCSGAPTGPTGTTPRARTPIRLAGT